MLFEQTNAGIFIGCYIDYENNLLNFNFKYGSSLKNRFEIKNLFEQNSFYQIPYNKQLKIIDNIIEHIFNSEHPELKYLYNYILEIGLNNKKVQLEVDQYKEKLINSKIYYK
jgi:hypothetical protein